MNIYIILIIVCAIVFIVAGMVLMYLIFDEKKIKEVDNELLARLRKQYTKEEFENTMYDKYVEILMGIQNESYNFLRDSVSDEEYNKILLEIKNNKDHQQMEVVSNIQKGFSKLISYKLNNDLEVAKVWIQYTDNEYTLANREVINTEGQPEIQQVVIKGDKKKNIYHEYILTFVKGRSNNEDILCPNCGYHTKLLTSSKCIRCDSTISPKRMHWVYVDKVATNISKGK